MTYWLVKSEPETWSWHDHLKKGVEPWYGVRNYQASNNLKAMKIGDRAYFYHSVKEKQIMGILEVVKEYYPDHTDEKGRFGMVDFKAIEPLPSPVTLAQIKATPELADMPLIRQSRLSVMPVTPEQWNIIDKMAKNQTK